MFGLRFQRAAFAALMPLALLASCGGGGGGGGAAGDLTGNWQFFLDVTGEEVGPFPVYLMQNGTTLDGANLGGTINGSTFTVVYPGFLGYDLVLNGTTNGNGATGTVTVTGLPISGTFRMLPLSPDGDISVTGMVSGNPADFSGTTAVGAREYDDPGKTNLQEVEVSFGDGSIFFELTFQAAGLSVGTLNVGSGVQVEIGYVTDAAQVDVTASGGTVTVTRYDGAGIAGTFSISLPGGDMLNGSFDVDWDIEAYEP